MRVGTQITEKIIELYPEIKKFNLDVTAEFSDEKNEWIITLSKGKETLQTHIKTGDALKCIEGEKCVYFGNQLMGFIDAYCSGSDACKI
ncbi:hypothetical protein [Maridesulfovibrio ferrireducens]|uniref:hypothetical protein n=1 Tax=Maridesulfovibrio ferrireducens TaxID=246191 RepID=UPI001A21399D|nr:hypothetical protein [Maridesulfovibrio ferrireducens]MBI9111146.1 hypothetical protein [Maridesulfovibrio ferrireducens]